MTRQIIDKEPRPVLMGGHSYAGSGRMTVHDHQAIMMRSFRRQDVLRAAAVRTPMATCHITAA